MDHGFGDSARNDSGICHHRGEESSSSTGISQPGMTQIVLAILREIPRMFVPPYIKARKLLSTAKDHRRIAKCGFVENVVGNLNPITDRILRSWPVHSRVFGDE